MDNNRQAQHELYMRFVHMMKGICLRYAANEAEAEDILQEAFIQAFKRLDSYNGKGALGGWLRRITINKALEQYRKNKSVSRMLDGAGKEMRKETVVGDDSVYQQLELEDLLAKIQEMPVGYRTIFNLYAVEGYTHREIAELLKISEGTSKSQFSRARNFLIKLILDEEKEERIRLTYARR
jgi:RNA polymerase sigma-70 factor (ECF subfamily)